MKTIDRSIPIALVVGVWGLIGTIWLKPSDVIAHGSHVHFITELYGTANEKHSHSTYDIDGLKWKVEKILEDCYATGRFISCKKMFE